MLFATCSHIFNRVMQKLHRIICLNPDKCEHEQDLFGQSSSKAKLMFVFSNSEEGFNDQYLRFVFGVNELFYVNAAGRIAYNFDSLQCGSGEDNFVRFGLLFFHKYSLILNYMQATKKFNVYVFPRRAGLGKLAIGLTIVACAAVSIAMTLAFKVLCYPLDVSNEATSLSHSLHSEM